MVGDNPVFGDNEPRPLIERLGVFIANDYEYDRSMCALVDVLSSNLWPSLCTAHRRNQAAKNGCGDHQTRNHQERRRMHREDRASLQLKMPTAFRRRARGRSRATNGAHGVTCAMGQSPHLGRIWLLIRLK